MNQTMRQMLFLLLFGALTGCSESAEKLFTPVSPETSGILFSNTITYSDTLSVLDFEYMYNGGGVGIADINNDGLQDVYFSGNMVSGKLYLNNGDFRFEDITAQSGLVTDKWTNGVSIVDINQDGFQDIYLSIGGNRNTPESDRRNLLYINNGDNTFTESAGAYGLDDTGYAIQSSFFDYDLDGDLDMYLLRNSFVDYHRNTSRPKLVKGEAYSTDRLFRNNGDNTFTDVSAEAGILIEGFGLGVEIADINEDGWPDVYVANDFITNDLMWINNGNGTFTNRIGEFLKHQTYNGMGTDIADYNNDGKVDIVVLDMLPEDNKRWKLTPRGNTYDEFQRGIQYGYEHQYLRNTLQLNNGNNTFSEIGQLAGIEATEWSWSALFGDYDNDGLKDLFITNGYGKDITNLDFIVYGDQTQSLGVDEASKKERQAMLNALPGIKVPNYIYKNNGDLTFSDNTTAWGISTPTFSNGAAYADLDNDGDLDLVINNIDDQATVLESTQQHAPADQKNNFLRIALDGPPKNRDGFGTTVLIKTQGKLQHQYLTPVRGYLSSVEPVLHFGLGRSSRIDTVEVTWPDGRRQVLRNVAANQLLSVDHRNASEPSRQKTDIHATLFKEVTPGLGIDYFAHENPFVDFKVQPILPHMHSRNGPGIAVGDVNGDALEDVYIGGAAGFRGGLFVQRADGHFQKGVMAGLDSLSEEMGVLFFDADNDEDLDLYAASGGSEQKKLSVLYRDHLYINDGRGAFTSSETALPDNRQSKSCVVAGDYDRDGDLDLFLGGRVSPWEYPMPARSAILRNDSEPGVPKFTDVTESIPGAMDLSMVCAALWTDYDNDGWLDLLVAGEFLPLQFFHNEGGKLQLGNIGGLKNTAGWWNSLASGDFDNDGDTDYIAGNLGLNNHYRASGEEPLCIHASDYNKDGRVDPVMSYYVQGKNYVGHPRDILIDQINSMRARFRTYTDYANATFEQSFLPEELSSAYVVCARKFESSYVENLGHGKFEVHALPLEAQFSPVYGILTGDYDMDGFLDLLLTGNSYSPEVISGRDDASIGLFLRGDGTGHFVPSHVRQSGFFTDGDSKGMARVITGGGKELILVANNSDKVRAFEAPSRAAIFNPAADDNYAIVSLPGGKSMKCEFHYGSGYLSHSSRVIQFPVAATKITVYNSRGNSREIFPAITKAK